MKNQRRDQGLDFYLHDVGKDGGKQGENQIILIVRLFLISMVEQP